jgi:hypothetical protein
MLEQRAPNKTARNGEQEIQKKWRYITVVVGKTRTRKGVQSINTSRAILTRIGSTFIGIGLTDRTRRASSANTRETVQRVGTRTTILTRIGSTFIDVGLTGRTRKPGRTKTREAIQSI